jgi:hypothetical protein
VNKKRWWLLRSSKEVTEGRGKEGIRSSLFGAKIDKTLPINDRSYNGGVNNM